MRPILDEHDGATVAAVLVVLLWLLMIAAVVGLR